MLTLHIVLNGCSCQQQPVAALETKKSLPSSTGGILDILGLVENHILPLYALEVLLILRDLRRIVSIRGGGLRPSAYQLIAGDENVERSVFVVRDFFLRPEFPKSGAILDITPVGQGLQFWHKPSDFLLPVVQRGGGRHNQEWTPYVMSLRKISKQ